MDEQTIRLAAGEDARATVVRASCPESSGFIGIANNPSLFDTGQDVRVSDILTLNLTGHCAGSIH